MRFNIIGADKESGDDVELVLEALSQSGAEELAIKRGIMVSAIKEMPAKDEGAISLVDDEPSRPLPAARNHGSNAGTATAHAPAHAPAHAAGHAGAGGHEGGNGNGDHGQAAHPDKQAHGHITVSAGSPSDTAHTSEGTSPLVEHHEQALEYHILMNQALYLLETAVNKYARDGWEPQGGLTVGVANNAMQYFQALVRRKKVAG